MYNDYLQLKVLVRITLNRVLCTRIGLLTLESLVHQSCNVDSHLYELHSVERDNSMVQCFECECDVVVDDACDADGRNSARIRIAILEYVIITFSESLLLMTNNFHCLTEKLA